MTLDIDESTLLESFGKVRKYKKLSLTKAVQMNDSFEIITNEDVLQGNSGDYLCEDIEGNKYPVKKKIFEETYEEVSVK